MDKPRFALRPDLPGANLVGYFRAESGVGEHARTLAASFDAAGIPFARTTFERTLSRQGHRLDEGDAAFPIYGVNLLFVNADETPRLLAEHPELREGRYSIGYWAWEVEEFPDAMAASAALVDEIWANSSHAARAIARKITDRPVLALSPAVDPPPPERFPEGRTLPPAPRVLVSFDYDSVFERKNPLGAVAAFRAAFPEPGPARLIVKSINGDRHPELRERLTLAIGGRPDVTEIDGYLSRGQQAGLIAACDLFLSLHRAEGFGLMLAEAMLAGKPVIATAYSGNLDFMSAETAHLVPFRMIPVAPGSGPYSGVWAEPDLEAAAALIRKVIESPEESAALGRRARAAILAGHTPEARATQISARLGEIRSKLRLPAPTSPVTGDLQAKLHQLAAGVNLGPARRLPPRSLVARTLLRLLAPFWRHQQEVDRAFLEILGLEVARREVEISELRSEVLHSSLSAQGRARLARHRDRGTPVRAHSGSHLQSERDSDSEPAGLAPGPHALGDRGS